MGVENCPKMEFNPPPLQCLSLKKSHSRDKMVLILGKTQFHKNEASSTCRTERKRVKLLFNYSQLVIIFDQCPQVFCQKITKYDLSYHSCVSWVCCVSEKLLFPSQPLPFFHANNALKKSKKLAKSVTIKPQVTTISKIMYDKKSTNYATNHSLR